MEELQVKITITDPVTLDTHAVTGTIPVEQRVDMQEGAWDGAANDEQKNAIRSPNFKQYAEAIGHVMLTGMWGRFAQYVGRKYRPPSGLALTFEPPTGVEP
jgi:hypothetical protein